MSNDGTKMAQSVGEKSIVTDTKNCDFYYNRYIVFVFIVQNYISQAGICGKQLVHMAVSKGSRFEHTLFRKIQTSLSANIFLIFIFL
jgi:hypothetical protein